MCLKKQYRPVEVDLCLQTEVKRINKNYALRTLASCCGHNKYPKTIVVQNKYSRTIFEYFTGIRIFNKYKNGKKRRRFYKKDQYGYYFIPEVN